MIYELYGKIHSFLRRLFKKSSKPSFRMINVGDKNIANGKVCLDGSHLKFFNDTALVREIYKQDVFPVENIVPLHTLPSFDSSYNNVFKPSKQSLGIKDNQAEELWKLFISKSVIPNGFKNQKLHFGGYILNSRQWCLPSWIWTNGALVRMYCKIGEIEKGKNIADLLVNMQQECGGWIVRNDYDSKGSIPVVAPNDSAYIANNACLEMFLACGDKKYLNSAIKCANWIINTSREDGMVYVGYNLRDQKWIKTNNIVDVGFTAGFFAKLFEITCDNQYLTFLRVFVKKYISLFYLPDKKGFATSLNSCDLPIGGMFGRGQAWALEGLIPAYRVLKDQYIKKVIDETVSTLVKKQHKDGGWSYNLSRPLMGVDCKAVPVIALSLLLWGNNTECVKKALSWCEKHTASSGDCKGGIFSYTTEGAIVHNHYTYTAFVYSSAYALETKILLNKC